ncbi:hypothetical protein [Flavobacterium hibernum]|uniref:Uncharacterized protein n=1 Tax=Flavobacterium hibernum TaxID=37752 RepID=A0A0D0F2K9_9FLAO|nr:hypothetical protein [Flavobacterium hibernum]KIO52342.1 hypothetical protein IW18_14595 [Flavobacterium hibernum]OXA87189.1 hypothetical protein B0A73_12845 [Flavobacterium hibernum]STO14239.1 Uncharacterised protein [Flavobacterium hibernum]
MKCFFIFLFLSIFNCYGQQVSEINKILRIPNALEFEKEIRIYKDYSTSETIKILRMYDEGKDNWIVQIFWYSKSFNSVTKIDQIQFPKENLGKLIAKDANLIWLNLLLTNIEFLPSMESIEYKLNTPYIDLEKGEQIIARRKTSIIDGNGYQVYIRNGKIKNNFSFNNAESYLKHFPKVDELVSYNELLSILKKEFNL